VKLEHHIKNDYGTFGITLFAYVLAWYNLRMVEKPGIRFGRSLGIDPQRKLALTGASD
jgi:hypothetical protein